jgi:hypothetical protein
MARWPTRGDADKTGEGGNVDEGFDPLHAGQSASRRFVPKWLVCLVGDRAGTRAFSVLIESEPKVWILVSTRFLHANRYPLRSKTLYSAGSCSRSSSRTRSAMLEVSSRSRLGGGGGLSCRRQRLNSLEIIPASE